MIEDEKLGVKIAENSDEAFWTNKKEEVINSIAEVKRNQLILEKLLELCEELLKK